MSNKIILGLGGFGVNFINHIITKNNIFELGIIANKEIVDFSYIENKIYLDSAMVESITNI